MNATSLPRINHARISRCFEPAAFSITELLISLLVVGVLMAMILSGLSIARERASGTKCLNQIRTLAQVSLLWSADHNGRILPSGDSLYGNGWPHRLKPYIGDIFLKCAEFVKKYPEIPLDHHATGYGRNLFFSTSSGIAGWDQRDEQGRLTQVKDPARTVSFFEHDMMIGGDVWGGYVVDGADRWYYYLRPTHHGGFYLSFFDGHAEWTKFNAAGPTGGNAAADYEQYVWKPY